ncbi:MAG: ABC transporter permease [Acidobacteria bacterium]|nr:ABC transporter permease [Acidobacteriota bacterium]
MPSLRIVLRGLARSPLFAAVAILSLALGIGANTAMFSLLDQILLRTLPVRNPEELVCLYHPGPLQGNISTDESGGAAFSYPMFRNLQKRQTPFTGIAGARSRSVSVAYRNSASHGTARLVSGNYFRVLGVSPALGRLLTEDDDRTAGGSPVAAVSYYYWESRFGRDPSVLNQPIIVNGYPITIVGVAQKGFGSEKAADVPDLYLPISMRKEIEPEFDGFSDRRNYWISLIARLKPGVSPERAAAEINVAYRGELEQDIPLLRQPRVDFLAQFRAKKIVLIPGEHGRGWIRDEARDPLTVLMGMAVLVLAIACANVANLQLARSVARTREMAIRLSMGASRAQLVRQLLTESFVLAIAGGLFGLLAARWTLHVTIAMMPAMTGMEKFLTENIDARMLLFSLTVSVLTGILFGLFPALQASKADVASTIKDQAGQISGSTASPWLRKALVTLQMALSLMLLIAAGLFGRTLVNLSRLQVGIRTDHLMTFSLLPRLNRYSDERARQFHEQLSDRMSAIPGATMVTAALVPAIAGYNESTSVAVEGYVPPGDQGASSSLSVVGAGYFRTMELPLIAGREFTGADNAAAPRVALVNQAFVRRFFEGRNPLGRHIGRGIDKPDMEIVGVVKDAPYSDTRQPVPPVFYSPLAQSKRWGTLFYYVRTAVEPLSVAAQIRRAVAALDPNLPVRELKTMQAQIEENDFEERILMRLTAAMAGLATILAAVGLYGVLAFNVARRTREIGIRMALGAGAGDVRGLVMREMLLILAAGTVAGLGAAAASLKVTQSLLFGLKPWDAAVYAAAAAVLWAVALGAAYLPARRATAVDPVVALRYE